ncbi:hypothetical protein [Pseudocolwellia agarivorans]|uniref:hypothetical protein n=1 Tax=Pseudocolwellia agarivorans TaxID=1911682 RepID=UPI001588EAE5|nr:hypothetical protein [Pseudocolwellia agarivorans]
MPKYPQPKKTWFYPVDFKIKAVQLSLRDDVSSKDVDQALIPPIKWTPKSY